MDKVIGIFKPIHNTIGYEVREAFINENGKIDTKTLKVDDYKDIIETLPVFFPAGYCGDGRIFYKQFEVYGLKTRYYTTQESLF